MAYGDYGGYAYRAGQRIEELARMLGGKGEAARKHAKALLDKGGD